MDKPIVITGAQRDALYELCLNRLSGLGDLWPAIEEGEYDAADRLGREFSDDLRLILDDLGWGDVHKPVTLTLPPTDLRRAFTRLREHAVNGRSAQEAELNEVGWFLERADLVTSACDEVLAVISDGS